MTSPRNDSSLNEVISRCESLVNKSYLNTIHNMTFCPAPNTSGTISLLKIETLTTPLSPEFFTFVLSALGNLNEVFGYILESCNHRLILYVGLKTTGSMRVAVDLLKNGLKSSYPSSKFRELSPKESSLILVDLFNPSCYHALSSAIVIPNNTSSSNAPINQKLVDLMGNEDFAAFFLASPFTRCEIKCFIDELKGLYTTLSSFAETEYSSSQSFAKNTASHVTKSITENNNTSCTETNGTEHASSTSQYTLIAPAAIFPLQNTRTFSISIAFNQTCGIVDLDNQSVAQGETKGCSASKTNLHITSTTHTKSDSVSYVNQNKFVIDLLPKLDDLISRLNLASSSSLFSFGAYFLSSSLATSIRAAYTYSGLAADRMLNIENPFITTWEEGESIFPKLIEELRNFNHLSFSSAPKNECITTTAPITSSELLNSFYFPYSNRPFKSAFEL